MIECKVFLRDEAAKDWGGWGDLSNSVVQNRPSTGFGVEWHNVRPLVVGNPRDRSETKLVGILVEWSLV